MAAFAGRVPPTTTMAFTLLEMTVGVGIVAVGALAVTSTALAGERIDAETRDLSAARSAIERTCDEVRTASRAAAVERATWSRSLVEALADRGAPSVAHLVPWPGADEVLAVTCVVDETFDPREAFGRDVDAVTAASLGLPRDLDGDGAATNRDVTDTALALPVLVTARWQTDGVRRELVHVLYASPF